MTIADLLNLQQQAINMAPQQGPEWPPSVYYRYLGLLLQKLTPKVFVELGTDGGGCARTVARMNPDAKIITIDLVSLKQAQLAAQTTPNMECVLGDSVKTAKTIGAKHRGQISLLFVDTVHEYDHALAEFTAWREYLAPGAVVCFDDLYREGLDRLWADLPEPKTKYHDLAAMHVGGSPTDGGFGALILP